MTSGEWGDYFYKSEKYFLLWLAQTATKDNELTQEEKNFVTDMGLITLVVLSEWLQTDIDENKALVKAITYFIDQRFKYCTDVIVEYDGYKKRIMSTTKDIDKVL